MNKNVCNYDCYATTICVSNNLLKKRDWWCYLQAVWMIRSKVFPVFYGVVFMNGCEEGVLNGKKWRQQDIGDIEVSKFKKHKNTFLVCLSAIMYFPRLPTFLCETSKEISVEERLAGPHGERKKCTNTLMLLFIFHSYSSANSLCWGLAPSQTSPWCPCWQRWWGCQCRSVWSCGMWRSSEGLPGESLWRCVSWTLYHSQPGMCFI